MVQHRKFMNLALDDEGLHTPDGVLDLSQLTRVDVIRNRQRERSGGSSEPSGAGVLGGALLGGAIAGPLGAVGGGILGSRARYGDDDEHIPRTVSATLIFESPELAYSTTVQRDRAEEAEAFVAAVKDAAGL
ncbi:MAG: hypothetical protein Q8K99_03955 [Actinomycetota bacterium]|nr:hypothetical protein [Actinomycetota bacterium]